MQRSLHPAHIYGWSSLFVTYPFGSYINHNHFAGFVEMAAVVAVGAATIPGPPRGGAVSRSPTLTSRASRHSRKKMGFSTVEVFRARLTLRPRAASDRNLALRFWLAVRRRHGPGTPP